MTALPQLIHATTVAIGGRGVMLRGPSGSGKSSLALRLLEETGNGMGQKRLAAALVADDQTEVFQKTGKLWVRCPQTIRGKLEVRGLGIVTVKPHAPCRLALVVDLVAASKIPRLPEPEELRLPLMGHDVARIMLDGRDVAAPSIVRLALRQVGNDVIARRRATA